MVYVQLGAVENTSWAHNVGMFSGQNIQNSWDAHASSASAFGGSLGDLCLSACLISVMQNYALNGQNIADQDSKGNRGWANMR